MLDSFDKRTVSFMAVTQQLNTTSSLGRLTLNILLSFAQFERETLLSWFGRQRQFHLVEADRERAAKSGLGASLFLLRPHEEMLHELEQRPRGDPALGRWIRKELMISS
jgi:DNA invertase Pin-like site-specific DNA recombinase